MVPHEILERRRKAYQLRAPLDTLWKAYPRLEKLSLDSALASAVMSGPISYEGATVPVLVAQVATTGVGIEKSVLFVMS
jgi:hypothetical protein